MRILGIADIEEDVLWNYPERYRDLDCIISCGDLLPEYLEYLVTMTNLPLFYVRGNHDGIYDDHPPGGCICLDGRVIDFKGIRIMGLGGSMRYRHGKDQYTEKEMCRRIMRVRGSFGLIRGIDLLVTHAPAAGYGDLTDLPHRGFDCFDRLLQRENPVCMLHGHVHMNYGILQREQLHPAGTIIINVSGHRIVELPVSFRNREGRLPCWK